jgi:DNA-binding SARP family transcriptional activator/tetratricopeptide (TPR) repeat protein
VTLRAPQAPCYSRRAVTQLRLRLFGGFEARNPGGQVIAFPRKKAEALLAFLVLQRGKAYAREKLATLLWGGADSDRARHSLRQVLVSLRKNLASARAPVLVEDGESVAIDLEALEVDVLTFERLITEGTPGALAQAADLYHGDLLAGLGTEDTEFDAWLLARRERVRETAVQSLARLFEHQRAQGQDDEAIATGVRLLAMDRTQEAVHRSLMRLYSRQGRRGAALRQYQGCIAALEHELGVPPEDETRLLYRELLRANATETPGKAAQPLFGRAAHTRPADPGTPLSGRDDELSQLRALCGEIAQGRGASVVILGDGGIGKSRLVEALVEYAESAGALVLLGRAWEAERNLPFGPWVHAFRTTGVIRDLAAGLDAQSQRELARLFPDLGLPPGDAPAEDHVRVFEAMEKILQRLSLQGPLVVVIEDLHWADEMSARLLAHLTRAASDRPVLFAVTARADQVSSAPLVERMLTEIGRQPGSRKIVLAPISRADTLAVVNTLMRVGAGGRAIRSLGERAWRISKGNPFLITETVRAARDAGVIDQDQAAGQQTDDVVAGRLDSLTGIAAQLAAVAAVIGREFDLELLARASDLKPAEAAEGIAELVERRLLHAVGEHLDFTHDHIRTAAYTGLTNLHRRMLHGAVAHALEEINADDLASQYLALGRHCYQSERWDRAFHYLRAAGLSAAARSAHREAVASFELALAAGAQLPQNPERVRTAIDISFSLRGSLVLLGDLKGTLDCLRAAEPHARNLGDPGLQAWVSIFTGNCLTVMGRHAEAIEIGEKVIAIAAAGRVPGLKDYWAANVLGTSRFFLGDFRHSQAVLRPAAAAIVDDADYRQRGVIGHPGVISLGFLALSLAETGDFDDATAHATSALALSQRLDSTWDTVRACFTAGAVHLRRGEFSTGIPILRHGVELARIGDLPMGTRVLTPILGSGLAHIGEFAEALKILAPVVAAPLLPYCLNFVAEAYLLAGRPDEAAGIAARALEQSTGKKEQGVRAWALWLQGSIAIGRARADRSAALAHFRQALAMAEEREMRPLAAHCLLGMGKLHAAAGRPGEAGDAFAQAGRRYEEMGMAHWTKRVPRR